MRFLSDAKITRKMNTCEALLFSLGVKAFEIFVQSGLRNSLKGKFVKRTPDRYVNKRAEKRTSTT